MFGFGDSSKLNDKIYNENIIYVEVILYVSLLLPSVFISVYLFIKTLSK